MRYFLDTEFIERGSRHPIDLISIGLVCEDGREYYAISTEFNPRHASKWVQENVISQLPPRNPYPLMSPRVRDESLAWKRREVIAIEVMAFLKNIEITDTPCGDYRRLARSPLTLWFDRPFGLDGFSKHSQPGIVDLFNQVWECDTPEIWAYYADYDWVVFCQLFGTMMDLPKGFPMFCRDLKQECDRLGNPKLPEQGVGEHNALDDARWNKRAWEFLQND